MGGRRRQLLWRPVTSKFVRRGCQRGYGSRGRAHLHPLPVSPSAPDVVLRPLLRDPGPVGGARGRSEHATSNSCFCVQAPAARGLRLLSGDYVARCRSLTKRPLVLKRRMMQAPLVGTVCCCYCKHLATGSLALKRWMTWVEGKGITREALTTGSLALCCWIPRVT